MTDLAIVKEYYPKPYLTELERGGPLLGRLHACLCS